MLIPLKRTRNHKNKQPPQTCRPWELFVLWLAKLKCYSYYRLPCNIIILSIQKMSFYLYCQLQGLSLPLNTLLQDPNHTLYLLQQQLQFSNLNTLQNNFSPVFSTVCLPRGENMPNWSHSYAPVHSEEIHSPRLNGDRKRRRACIEKQMKSAKKNGESNLINQLLSFLSLRQKSQKLVTKAIRKVTNHCDEVQKVFGLFYNIIRLINIKRGRKYVNRNLLLQYFTVSSWRSQIPEIMPFFHQSCSITAQQMCCVFRSVCYEFIRNYSLPAVLTSKRISVVAKKGHLRRIRTLATTLGQLQIA